jgi:hypothetical protein
MAFFSPAQNLKPGVLGFVNDTHPSAAKFLDDVVVRNCVADQSEGIALRRMLGLTAWASQR